MTRFLAIALFALATGSALATPVGDVVELIKELKAKTVSEGEAEQKTYDKFACWCETTTKRKADAIDAGKARIKSLTTSILELKGKKATLASEMEKLTADIAENEAAQEEATEIRQKENANYQQEKSETETAIGALEKAVTVLGGAGTKGEELVSVASALRHAVAKTALTQEKSKVVRSFIADPEGFYEDKAQAKASYSPASATIQGILKDMYTTFAGNLEDSTKDEAIKQRDFEAYIAAKTKELNNMKTTLVKKEEEHGETSKNLADTQVDLEDTTAQLRADEKFFEEATVSCKTKADEWSERARLRTEELDGINKALAFLTSDEARELFEKATGNRANKFDFVQIRASTDVEPARAKAVGLLKGLARKTKSVQLMSLAATLRTAAPAEFKEVMKAIDDVMSEMHQEGADDIKQRDNCIEEQDTFTNDRDDLQYDIEQLDAQIGKLEAHAADLESEIDATVASMNELDETMKASRKNRNEEHSLYQQTRKDDEDAIALLGKAIGAMSKYFKNNKVAMKLLQKDEPVFAVSEDQAPDATFTGANKGAQRSAGIVGLLTKIQEDLQDDVATGKKEEAEAQEAFESLTATQEMTMENLKKTKASLEGQLADTRSTIKDKEADKKMTQGEKKSKVDYLTKIQPNCEWIRKNFQTRAEQRKAELEGLLQAKQILEGASGGQFGLIQSFLQRRA